MTKDDERVPEPSPEYAALVKEAARQFVAGAAPSHLEAPLRRMREEALAKQYEPRIRAALDAIGIKELLAERREAVEWWLSGSYMPDHAWLADAPSWMREALDDPA